MEPNKKTMAVYYAEKLGWAVIPVYWIEEDGKCSCKKECSSPGKHPYAPFAPNGRNGYTKDVELIRQWWTDQPDLNIGIAMGEPSGVVCLDVDCGNGKTGAADFHRMVAEFGAFLPDGIPSAQSGSGGYHYLFAYPEAGVKDVNKLYGDIDLKADGRGYIVVAPSSNANGDYKWLLPPWEAAAVRYPSLPEFLLKLANERPDKADAQSFLYEPWDGTLPLLVQEAAKDEKVGKRLVDRDPEGLNDHSDSAIDNSIVSLLAIRGIRNPVMLQHSLLWSWKNKGLNRGKARGYFDATISAALERAREHDPVPTPVAPSLLPFSQQFPTSPQTVSIRTGQSSAIQTVPSGFNGSPRQLTDRANAERFKEAHAGALLYDSAKRKWIEYHDGKWVHSNGKKLIHCDAVSSLLYWEHQFLIGQGIDRKTDGEYKKAIEAMDSTPIRSRCVSLAEGLMDIEAQGIKFDNEHFTVLCEDGALEIAPTVATLRQPVAEDYFTKRAAAMVNGPRSRVDDAGNVVIPADFWAQRVAQAVPDPNVRWLFQLYWGTALTASMRYQVFGFSYGPPETGKSTINRAALAVLGDYGVETKYKYFTEGKNDDNGGSLSPELMRLKGTRMACAFEVKKHTKFDTAKVKSMTGGESIIARGLYADEEQFPSTCKLMFVGNHRPGIDRDEGGMWRRILVFPFNSLMSGKVDVDIDAKLSQPEVRTQILHWMLSGWYALQAWHKANPSSRFPMVPECLAEMEDYQEDADPLADFIDECCQLDPKHWVASADLFRAYDLWAGKYAKDKMGKNLFHSRILRPGIRRERDASVQRTRGYSGVQLNNQMRGRVLANNQ